MESSWSRAVFPADGRAHGAADTGWEAAPALAPAARRHLEANLKFHVVYVRQHMRGGGDNLVRRGRRASSTVVSFLIAASPLEPDRRGPKTGPPHALLRLLSPEPFCFPTHPIVVARQRRKLCNRAQRSNLILVVIIWLPRPVTLGLSGLWSAGETCHGFKCQKTCRQRYLRESEGR